MSGGPRANGAALPAWRSPRFRPGVLGAVALALLALLAGCQTVLIPGGPPDAAAWKARLALLEQVGSWQLLGRIGVVTRKRGGSASLSWREQGPWMSLSLSGPFGVGAVRLWGDPGEMHIRNAKGREWVTDAPETALEQSLGWPIPLASLRYWVTGQPAPGRPYRLVVGRRGLLSRLEQEGWTVRYTAYARSGGLLLPVTLTATRPGGRIKLIVSRWTLAGTPR